MVVYGIDCHNDTGSRLLLPLPAALYPHAPCQRPGRLGPAVPSAMTVLLCDRGQQSPGLWTAICSYCPLL